MGRIQFPDPDTLTAEQRAVYNKIVRGPRGRIVGPLRAVLLNPELADRWQHFGAQLRYETSLPKSVTELAILVVGRHYNSQVEWFVHATEAAAAGVPQDSIEAILARERPKFDDSRMGVAYEYARRLLAHGDVDDELHARAKSIWGDTGVVELTAVIGYYTMVAMMLNAQAVPTPDASMPLGAEVDDHGLPLLSPLPPMED